MQKTNANDYSEDTRTIIVAMTLNFKAHFKFSRLNFFLDGTPVPLRCAIKAWAISSVCINFRAQNPLGAEI